MSKEKRLIPYRRFKQFINTGAWEQRKLGDMGKCQSGIGFPESEQGGISGIPFYKVSDMNNVGNEQEMTNSNNYVSDEQIKRKKWQPIVDVPAVIFAKVGAAIMLNRKRLCRQPFLIDNNTMAYIFDSDWDINFGKTLFEKIDLTSLVQVGALPSYNASDVEAILIYCPSSSDEQKAIGICFKYLDQIITLQQHKLEKLKSLKKAYLSAMFPAEGQRKPKLRFKGFTDDWEQCKLGDCFGERNERSGSGTLISVTINQGVIKSSDLERFDNSSSDKSNYKKVYINDIAYNSMRMWQGASGYSRYEGIVSPAYTVLYPQNVNSIFFSYLFKTTKLISLFEKNSQGLTTDTWNLKYPALSKIKIYRPSLSEQEKLSSFLEKVDEFITLHQRKLEKLQNIKKAYLNEMFV